MRQNSLILLILILFLLLTSCHKQYLSAYLTEEEYLKQVQWKTKIDTTYKVKKANPEKLKALSEIRDSVETLIFFGTWCSDSKKWIPRLLSIKENLPIKKYTFVAIDTTKKDEKLWVKQYGVKKVPTIIFLRDNHEVGRIVEKPKKGLENNIYKIITEKFIK
jgi:thiol-disulfide isomerase/thioredoxin